MVLLLAQQAKAARDASKDKARFVKKSNASHVM